ncbi:MAG: sigma-70 family RNA polymerase sigma factor [Bacteroidota bacterium]
MSKNKDIQQITALKVNLSGAYKGLYRDYFNMVRHFVLKNSGSDDDAKDVFQESMVSLFEWISQPNFVLKAKLSTMIYSIARNIWLKQLRSEKGKVRLKDFEQFTKIEVEKFDEQQERQITLLEKALETLGEPCKGILHRFYYLKQGMKDIALAYNYKSADHAKAQKYKCLQRLKKSVK